MSCADIHERKFVRLLQIIPRNANTLFAYYNFKSIHMIYKRLDLKRFAVVPFLIVLTSCVFEEDKNDFYQQFTSDDLKYLITPRRSYSNNGEADEYDIYSLKYLLNRKDTLNVSVKTKLYNEALPKDFWAWDQYYMFCGRSSIYFDCIGFPWLTVKIAQDTVHNAADKVFEVCVSDTRHVLSYKYLGPASDSLPKLDTARVLGRTYHSVHKFFSNTADQELTRVKSFYFAKGVGFIRVESVDGLTLELLDGGVTNRQ
jgi:hypothetical protein